MSYEPRDLSYSDRDCEMESLQRQIRELELEMKGRRLRKNLEETSHGHDSTTRHTGGSSHQGHSGLSRDRSNESRGRISLSPRRERHEHSNAALDAMSQALRRVAWLPFSKEIKCTEMPRHFTLPSFTCYDDKTNPIEHVSHFTQLMEFYSQNDFLLCKVFPSNLGPMTMRLFNGLKKGSIHNFRELIQAFRAHFMTCNRVLQPIDALLSIKMGSKETLRLYADQYWELYNEIRESNE